MTIWDFAVWLYARPGVEAACLRLQDVHGQCVCLFLWRLWSVSEGRGVDDETLVRAVDVARAWERMAAAPLREVRRRLKAPVEPVADDARARLRDQVAAAALAAERILLETLGALTPGPSGVSAEALPALRAVAAGWAGASSEADLQHLVMAARPERPLAEPHRSATNWRPTASG